VTVPLRILLLEDSAGDAELIQELLEAGHFVCDINRVQTRAEFVAALKHARFDLILADYKLPSFDGLSALKLALSARPDLPFIFVSGTLGEEVAVEVLKIGATDYVLKTRLSRLVPSVQRALREARERADRKKAEEALRRSEKELRDVIETIPTAAWTALPDGHVQFVNRQWREYTGLSAEASAGTGWQAAVHPEDLDRHADRWRASLSTGAAFESEVRYRRNADGQYRWFLTRAVPVCDEQGKILKWYGISTDVDDRKHAEVERDRQRQLEADLAHMNRVSMMGELAVSLAHEIKQPIAAAVTNANTCVRWLRRDSPDVTEACKTASSMVAALKHAAGIIDRVRLLYMRGTPKRELVDVNDIAREMSVLLGRTAKRNAISIRTELDLEIPTTTADRVQLQQVLMNLMLNGIEAMHDRGGELIVASKRTQNGQVSVSVSDSGIGLPLDGADRIFDAFFTTKPHGTGMGLSISRRIIESHGGHLWASPNTGQGATFQFTLPGGTEALIA
jgi:PAS domain S-box-containing protein